MVPGVCLGLISSVVWAVGVRIIYAMDKPSVASPSIGLELYVATVGGLLLSVVAVVAVSGEVAWPALDLPGRRSGD